MPNLSETLGALLKDLASSRVKADLFSRDASLEYIRDPLLRLFPVPRVEIRSADLELTFAVSAAQAKAVDEAEVARAFIAQNAPALRRSLMLVPAKPSRRSRQTDSLIALLQAKGPAIEDEIDLRLGSFLQSQATTLAEQILAAPAKVVKTVGPQASRILRATVREMRAPVAFTAQLQRAVNTGVQTWAETTASAIRDAIARAKAEAFAVDLAVTKDDLINVPPNTLARVKVTVDIQNYEWIESTDDEGRSVNKLVAL